MKWIENSVINQFGAPSIIEGVTANRPPAGQTGRLFVDSQALNIQRDNGIGWDIVSGGGGGAGYLPLTAGAGFPLTGDLYLTNKGIRQSGGALAQNVFSSQTFVQDLFTVTPIPISFGNQEEFTINSLVTYMPQSDNSAIVERAAVYAQYAMASQIPNYSSLADTVESAIIAKVYLNTPSNAQAIGAYTLASLTTEFTVDGNNTAGNANWGNYIGVHVKSPTFVNYVSGLGNTIYGLKIDSLADFRWDGAVYGIYQEGFAQNIFNGAIYATNSLNVYQGLYVSTGNITQNDNTVTNTFAGDAIFYKTVGVSGDLNVYGNILGNVILTLTNTGTSGTQWRAANPIDASGRIGVVDAGIVAGVFASYNNANARVGFIGDDILHMNYVAELGHHKFNAQVDVNGDLIAVNTTLSGIITQNANTPNFFNGEIVLGLGQQIDPHISAIAGSVKLKINGTYYYLAYMTPPV